MRNLKRALSLLLSSAMVLGMLVMGGSAESYKDVDRADNQEAIEVLQAVGIMTGDENGNFNPDKTVTRNEMAVIMSQLLNLDYDYYRGTNPFTDVPEWAAPYVAACAAEGVIAGIGNNQFGGEMKVTAAQASLMIMKALGYFENAEDFGSDWQVATIRQASYIDLFDGINANAETALTRNQIAQLVLNGLKSDMVYFTGEKGIQIGDITVGYKAEYTVRTSSDKKYNTLVGGTTDISAKDKYTIQLGEELYNGKLTEKADTDAFERPATTWRYDSKIVGTFAHDADLSYTTAVKVGTIYNDLGLSKGIADEDTTVYVDGAVVTGGSSSWDIVKGSRNEFGGNGALTEVYYDADNNAVTIVTVNTYVAKVAAAYAETTTKDAYITLNTGDNFTTPTEASGFTFETDEFAKDDIVAYTYSFKAGENCVESVKLAEKVTGTMSTYTTAGSVTVNGTKYDANTSSVAEITTYITTVDKSKEVSVYLDEYGYVLFVDAAQPAQYAVVLKMVRNAGDFNDTGKAKLLFTDGTVKTVSIDEVNVHKLSEGNNYNGNAQFVGSGVKANELALVANSGTLTQYDVVSYTVDSDDVYDLTLVADQQTGFTGGDLSLKNGEHTFALTSGNAANVRGANNTVYSDGKTFFMIYDSVNDSVSVYEGFANVPTVKHNGDSAAPAVTVLAKDGSNTPATVVFVEKNAQMTVSSDNKDVIFVKGTTVDKTYNTADGEHYVYDAFINGEETTIKVATDKRMTVDTLIYGPSYNSKDILVGYEMRIDAADADSQDSELYEGVGTRAMVNDVIKLGKGGTAGETNNVLVPYAYEKDVNVYSISVEGELTKISIDSIADDFNDQVFYKVNSDNRLTDVYIRVVDDTETVNPGNGNNLINIALTKTAGNNLTVSWNNAGGAYNTAGIKAVAQFYQVKDGVSYLLGSDEYAGALASYSALTSDFAMTQTGAYYATITIYDGTVVVDSATSAVVNLAI